jgi:hypothetical protein
MGNLMNDKEWKAASTDVKLDWLYTNLNGIIEFVNGLSADHKEALKRLAKLEVAKGRTARQRNT